MTRLRAMPRLCCDPPDGPARAQRTYPANDWEVITGEMVVCPGCAFAFGAEHVTQATGQYDCPNCGAQSRDGTWA